MTRFSAGDGVDSGSMITVEQIQERVQSLLGDASAGELRLDDFDAWLSRASWNMHQDSDLRAVRFASAIELSLAEFDADHIEESELRQQLKSLANEYAVAKGNPSVLSAASVQVFVSSSTSFNFQELGFARVGNPLVVASG